MKPYASATVFIDNSVQGRNTVASEIHKIKYYDPLLTDVFVDSGVEYKNTLDSWAKRTGVRVNYSPFSYEPQTGRNSRNLVVYIGHRRETDVYYNALEQAEYLQCDMIILP